MGSQNGHSQMSVAQDEVDIEPLLVLRNMATVCCEARSLVLRSLYSAVDVTTGG